jgi:hypothetical protein
MGVIQSTKTITGTGFPLSACTIIGAIGGTTPKPGNGEGCVRKGIRHKILPQHSSFEYRWIIWDDVGQSGMVFWLVGAVAYRTSTCRRCLSLGGWGEPLWNPCHSLIFDYLSISIEGKRPTQVILENLVCKFTHSWETAVKPTCVCVCGSQSPYQSKFPDFPDQFCWNSRSIWSVFYHVKTHILTNYVLWLAPPPLHRPHSTVFIVKQKFNLQNCQ